MVLPTKLERPTQPPSPRSVWLRQALGELNGIDDDIGVEGLPQISEDVTQEARRILRELGRTPIAPMVYSTEDGEIAIDFRSSTGTREAVLIELGDDGGGACFAFIDGKGRRARYSDSSDLPDEFARAQLSALAEVVLNPCPWPRISPTLARTKNWAGPSFPAGSPSGLGPTTKSCGTFFWGIT